MDVGVYVGSPEAYCGEGRGDRVVCARGKVWQGSGDGPELAHSEESDHTIASSTARAARRGLRLTQDSGRMYTTSLFSLSLIFFTCALLASVLVLFKWYALGG